MRRKKDRPQSTIADPRPYKPFMELEDVETPADLERWHNEGSLKTQQIRIPEHARHKPVPRPLAFIETARAHTTKARGKSGRLIDTYWFEHVNDREGYIEDAKHKLIPPRRTITPPPFLPRLKRLNGRKRVRYCRACNTRFECKRITAEFCSPKCRKAASRNTVSKKQG